MGHVIWHLCYLYLQLVDINVPFGPLYMRDWMQYSSFLLLAQQHPPPQWARASSFMRFLDHTRRRTAVGRTPLDEWSARRRDLCLTTHNTHNRQTCMLSLGFEATISAGERPQTHALDRAATGIGKCSVTYRYMSFDRLLLILICGSSNTWVTSSEYRLY